MALGCEHRGQGPAAGHRWRRSDPAAQPTSDVWPDPPQEAQPIQFCATELLEALTEIRNRRDQEIAQDHELAWEHGTLPSALIA